MLFAASSIAASFSRRPSWRRFIAAAVDWTCITKRFRRAFACWTNGVSSPARFVRDDNGRHFEAGRLPGGAGVTHVAMESTDVYWKPIWNLREDRFALLLVNARHIKELLPKVVDDPAPLQAAFLTPSTNCILATNSLDDARPLGRRQSFWACSASLKTIDNLVFARRAFDALRVEFRRCKVALDWAGRSQTAPKWPCHAWPRSKWANRKQQSRRQATPF